MVFPLKTINLSPAIFTTRPSFNDPINNENSRILIDHFLQTIPLPCFQFDSIFQLQLQ